MKILVRSVYDNNPPGRTVNVTTSGGMKGKLFSPMLLGPVHVYQGAGQPSLIAQNVENAWQFSKVYPEHDNNGEPNEKWYQWRKSGFDNLWAQRYPMGKNAIPLYSWNGKKLDYIQARKEIYKSSYSMAVHYHPFFSELIDIAETEQLTLLDYDVYPGDTADDLTFSEIINNPHVKMGHAYVLANMIEGVLNARL